MTSHPDFAETHPLGYSLAMKLGLLDDEEPDREPTVADERAWDARDEWIRDAGSVTDPDADGHVMSFPALDDAEPASADPELGALRPDASRPVYWPAGDFAREGRAIVQPLLDAGWTRRAGGHCGDPTPGGGTCRKLGAWGHPVHGEPGRPVCAPHALVRQNVG